MRLYVTLQRIESGRVVRKSAQVVQLKARTLARAYAEAQKHVADLEAIRDDPAVRFCYEFVNADGSPMALPAGK